jgi:hypothetical protein
VTKKVVRGVRFSCATSEEENQVTEEIDNNEVQKTSQIALLLSMGLKNSKT